MDRTALEVAPAARGAKCVLRVECHFVMEGVATVVVLVVVLHFDHVVVAIVVVPVVEVCVLQQVVARAVVPVVQVVASSVFDVDFALVVASTELGHPLQTPPTPNVRKEV